VLGNEEETRKGLERDAKQVQKMNLGVNTQNHLR
jgi:hypothetical protein